MVYKVDFTKAERKKKTLKFLVCLMNIGHSLQIREKVIEKYGFFPVSPALPIFFFVCRMSLECQKLPVFFQIILSNY